MRQAQPPDRTCSLQPDGNVLVMAWHNHKLRDDRPDDRPRADRVRRRRGLRGRRRAGRDGALFRQPKALTLDEAGNLYILDQQNFRVRMIDARRA